MIPPSEYPPSVTQELNNVHAVLAQSGIEPHPGLDYPGAAFWGMGGIFFSLELAGPARLAERVPLAHPELPAYLTEVQADLKKSAKQGDQTTSQIAHAFGRFTGAYTEAFPLGNANNRVRIDGRSISIAPYKATLPYAIQNVMEWGMGLNGILAYIQELKRGAFTVTALQKDPLEVTALHGMAEYHGITGEHLVMHSSGIASGARAILQAGGPPFDVVIARRVHMAGTDLTRGLGYLERLVVRGGFFIGEGPDRSKNAKYTDYRTVAQTVRRNTCFAAHVDEQWNDQVTSTIAEPNRTIIAERI